MKDTELYSQILGISDPWYVDHVEIDVHEQTIRVFLEHDGKAIWTCPDCGKATPIYDHREQREWRHLDSCQFKTLLVASLPRINCPKHGAVTVNAPWSAPNSRFTLLFEMFSIDVLSAVKVQVAAAKLLRLSSSQIHDIMHRAVGRGMSKRAATEIITHLSIDEKSFHSGHQYITVLGGPNGKRIIEIGESRTQDSVEALIAKGLTATQRQGVSSVYMDMWKAFMNAARNILPQARYRT